MVELSLVIPCYNEEKNVEKVARDFLGELSQSGIDYELILVDNGSTDGTAKVIAGITSVNKTVRCVAVPVNKGYGHGILEGMKTAQGQYIGFSDGDDQIPTDAIVRLFRRMKEENAQVGKTFRTKRGDGAWRKVASWGYSTILSLLFLEDLPDANGKPKLMRKDFYERSNLKSQDWFIDTEILLNAKKAGAKICAVPIEFKKRQAGMSNIRINVVLEFLRNIIKYKVGKI